MKAVKCKYLSKKRGNKAKCELTLEYCIHFLVHNKMTFDVL